MRKHFFWSFIFLIIVFFAVSWLRTNTSLFLPSILELSDCELPCWNQIEIDRTTMAEFNQIIAELDIVEYGSIDTSKYSEDYPYITSFYARPSKINLSTIHGIALFTENNLVYFSLKGNLNTKMKYFVDQFGEPDLVLLTGRRGYPGSSKVVNYITFVDLQRGIAYGSGVESVDVIISDDLKLEFFYMFDPKSFEALSNSGFFISQDNTYDWDGYGIIREKYFSKNN